MIMMMVVVRRNEWENRDKAVKIGFGNLLADMNFVRSYHLAADASAEISAIPTFKKSI